MKCEYQAVQRENINDFIDYEIMKRLNMRRIVSSNIEVQAASTTVRLQNCIV